MMKTWIIYSCIASISLFVSCRGDCHFDKALQLEQEGRYTEAIKHLDIVIDRNPKHYRAYINRGADKSELRDFNGAIEDYTFAIKIDSTKLIAYVNRGNNKKRINDYYGAIEDYTVALNRLGFDRNKPLNFSNLKQYDQNSLYKNEYIQYNIFDILYERGVAYYLADSLSQSIFDLNLCINSNKRISEGYYWRAFVFFKLGDKISACNDLQASALLENQDAIADYENYCDCKKTERYIE